MCPYCAQQRRKFSIKTASTSGTVISSNIVSNIVTGLQQAVAVRGLISIIPDVRPKSRCSSSDDCPDSVAIRSFVQEEVRFNLRQCDGVEYFGKVDETTPTDASRKSRIHLPHRLRLDTHPVSLGVGSPRTGLCRVRPQHRWVLLRAHFFLLVVHMVPVFSSSYPVRVHVFLKLAYWVFLKYLETSDSFEGRGEKAMAMVARLRVYALYQMLSISL